MEDTSRVRLSLYSFRPTFPGRINDRHYNDSAPPSLKLKAAQISEERHMGLLPESTVSTHEVSSSSKKAGTPSENNVIVDPESGAVGRKINVIDSSD